jgi:Anti-sigma-28 factor, FlgM/Sigma-70, region 4
MTEGNSTLYLPSLAHVDSGYVNCLPTRLLIFLNERLVFTLYYYEELETSEIALVLGETVFAVLQLHVSALVRLQDRLADPDSGLLDQIRAVDRTMDEGRAAKIANIKKAIAEGTYHVSAAEVARKIIDHIDEP